MGMFTKKSDKNIARIKMTNISETKRRYVMKYGYIRISTKMQNLEVQIEALNNFGVDRIFEEKESGLNTDRPVLNDVIDRLRTGDTLVIYDLSRLGRSFYQVMKLIDDFAGNSIGLVSIKENLDITTSMGRTMIRIMASFNQLQVELQNEKIIDGIANAKANGKKLGRRPISKSIVRTVKALYNQGYTNQEIADQVGISKRSVIRYKKTQEISRT